MRRLRPLASVWKEASSDCRGKHNAHTARVGKMGGKGRLGKAGEGRKGMSWNQLDACRDSMARAHMDAPTGPGNSDLHNSHMPREQRPSQLPHMPREPPPLPYAFCPGSLHQPSTHACPAAPPQRACAPE